MKNIADKAVQARKLLFIALPTCLALIAPSVQGQSQMAPGTFQPPKLPPIAHEAVSVTWPVPDYLSQALEVAKLQPTERSAGFKDASTNGAPPYLVLPVQSQAFGFSPAFRALVGAYLDQQLEAAGVPASRQTDSAGAYGPFVRRLSDTAVDGFVTSHPRQTVLALYLGHDGVDQTFVTLVARSGPKRQVAHQSVKLLADPVTAAAQLQQLLPALIRAVGIQSAATPPRSAKAGSCDVNAWQLATPTSSSLPGARACHAIVVGSLLPVFGDQHWSDIEASSPARFAWLAQAFVLAGSEPLASASAEGIRALALRQLALPVGATLRGWASLAQAQDPVVSRIAQLKGAYEATETGPSRSAREARQRLLEKVKQGLPTFVSTVLDAQAGFTEAFSEVDTCPMERALPGAMVRPGCRNSDAPAPASRAAWPAETLLFQEWRLAAYYKAVQNAEFTLGSRARTDEALRAWPSDVAAHPFLQRLRAAVESHRGARGSFDDQVKAARDLARRVTQTSVDLQRADRWLAAHSLTGHMWTNNLNIMNDAEVRDISLGEERLLSVLRFDRFTLDRYAAERHAGDPPLFLAPPQWLQIMAGPMPGLVTMAPPSPGPAPAIPLVGPAGTSRRQQLFSMHTQQMELASEKELSDAVSRNPGALHTRVDLASLQLRNGGSVADAIRLIDAAPDDARHDHRVAMSNAWAYPAHIFYFAGDLEAAQRYYRKVAGIGTGSESEMMARARLTLMEGRLREALDAAATRVERYDSDFARRDQVALLFMLGQSDKAWSVFLPNAASSQVFQLWVGAYTGHRMEGKDLAAVDRWIESRQLGGAQIRYQDARSLYLHLLATMDRMPTLDDIGQLKKRPPRVERQDPRWAASAQLFRSALGGDGFQDAHQAAKTALSDAASDPASSFMMPLYAWVAWQATNGKDEVLDEIRGATTRWDFDEILSKSLVLALDGDTKESLKFFNAARYELAGTSERPYPGPYSYALAGYLMLRKTGNDAYRQQTLDFVRSQQRVFPFYAWLYAMQALLDTDPAERATAACRAQYLDSRSYFLGLANVKGVNAAACKRAISNLLR